MAKMTISTPETRALLSFRFADQLPVTPSPVAPDAPLRRQGPSHPRFAAFDPSLAWVRPAVPLSPLTRRLQFAEVYRRMAASTPLSSPSHVPDSPHANLAPYSPLVFSSSVSSQSASLANELPDDLCSNPSDDSFNAFVERLNSKQANVGPWVLATHSPFSCESAVVSPSASSVTDSWSSHSTSIATVSSGSPLAYRLPVLQREHTLLGALVGKRVWRFSSADKEAYLNGLHRDDPHNLLQTPDNVARTASLHKWIANIPTPDAPSPAHPDPSLSLSPSLFSPVLSSPSSPSLAEQASPRLSLPASSDDLSFLSRSSIPASPSIRQSPAESIRSEHICSPVVKYPQSPFSTDALLKLKALVAAGPPSSVFPSSVSSSSLYPSSPSSVARSPTPVARSPTPVARSPTPVARSPSPVARSPSPVARSPSPTLTDALAKLKTLVEAGPPSPVALSPSPSPSPSPAPVVAKINTRSVLPRPTRSLKRKLPQDASPAPRRTRPAVTRFEPPTPVFHFDPTLPESLPSFPVAIPDMPGTFPTDMPTDLRLPVTPSSTSSSVSWKAVAGIAAGAFALGLVVSRYLF